MLGAAIRNDVRLAEALPREQLAMKDPFGRTPLLLAAWFESYDMLDWLGAQSKRATWQLDACYSKQVGCCFIGQTASSLRIASFRALLLWT